MVARAGLGGLDGFRVEFLFWGGGGGGGFMIGWGVIIFF